MSSVKSPEDKVVAEKDEAEELPPGWIKKVKIRKSGSITKVDRYYTDPDTGYIFRSLRDARRYVKTGILGRNVIKPKTDERLHMEESEESELKEHMSESLRRKQPISSPPLPELKTRQATRLSGVAVDAPPPSRSPSPLEAKTSTHLPEVAVDAPPPSSPSMTQLGPKTRQNTLLVEAAFDVAVPSSSPPIEPKIRKGKREAEIKIASPPPSLPDTRISSLATSLAETEIIISPPSQPESKTRQAKRVSGIRDNTSPPQPKARRATWQSGIKFDSPPPSPLDTRSSRQATKARPVKLAVPKESDKKTKAGTVEFPDMDIIIPAVNQENYEKQELCNKKHNNEIEMGPVTLPPREDQAPPAVVPLMDPEKQESPAVNRTYRNPIPQGGTDSSINVYVNDLWTNPCMDFAVKTLTGAIPFGDLNKAGNSTQPPLQVPLQELWTDPCIEFAVKTLTGAIPVGEDDYLPPRSTSSNMPRAPT